MSDKPKLDLSHPKFRAAALLYARAIISRERRSRLFQRYFPRGRFATPAGEKSE